MDFLITDGGAPWMLCECKRSDRKPASSLVTFGRMLRCERLVQVVEAAGVFEVHRLGETLVHIASASSFLACLV